MYILANVVLMVMAWLYNRSRQRQVLLRREQVNGCWLKGWEIIIEAPWFVQA
jgi:hypothetical protein